MNEPENLRGIRRTTATYRAASRQVRRAHRNGPNPIARGLATSLLLRSRAREILSRTAPAALVIALTDEDAALLRLGFAREVGITDAHARTDLDHARGRIREILAAVTLAELLCALAPALRRLLLASLITSAAGIAVAPPPGTIQACRS